MFCYQIAKKSQDSCQMINYVLTMISTPPTPYDVGIFFPFCVENENRLYPSARLRRLRTGMIYIGCFSWVGKETWLAYLLNHDDKLRSAWVFA
jgi:hypothetical protein